MSRQELTLFYALLESVVDTVGSARFIVQKALNFVRLVYLHNAYYSYNKGGLFHEQTKPFTFPAKDCFVYSSK